MPGQVAHGGISPSNILLTEEMWIKLALPHFKASASPWRERVLPLSPTELWVQGHMSNLDYLLWLNRMVGRTRADATYHPGTFVASIALSCRL